MSIDKRIEALTARQEVLTFNLELIGRDLESMRERSQQDGENIRAVLAAAEKRALTACSNARPRKVSSEL